jgi:hypothetical protein|tara:strand:- start:113 stop:232 length:120 start_codon:yes stop_codon:yes gene_type:complete
MEAIKIKLKNVFETVEESKKKDLAEEDFDRLIYDERKRK